jgi:hypothetical protein
MRRLSIQKGFTMKRVFFSLVAVMAFAAASAIPSIARASVIDVVTSSGFNSVGSGGPTIAGGIIATAPLSYADDWVEFYITPSSDGGIVAVDDLALGFAGETWKITGGSPTIGPFPANNSPTSVILDTGVDYYLAFNSGAVTPGPFGLSSYSLSLAPLPASFVLFGGGLGLLGLAGMRKGKKSSRRSLSPTSAV